MNINLKRMVIFAASRLSKGNKIIPDKIGIDENSVTVKSPRLFGGKQTSFPIGQIGASLKNPVNGFCEIEFLVNNKSYIIQGFTVHEAKMIKNMIQEKNTKVVNSGRDGYRSAVPKRTQDNGEDMMQFGQLLHLVDQYREKHLSTVKAKDSRVMISNGLKKEAADLIRFYNDLDIEILDDDEEIDKNKKITGIFIRDCLTKAGRDRIRGSIEQINDEEEDNEYTNGLESLLTMIDNICSSLVYKELDSENKPMVLFGLDNKKVVDKLADLSVSNSAKMSRIIGCVDSFINGIGNVLEKTV